MMERDGHAGGPMSEAPLVLTSGDTPTTEASDAGFASDGNSLDL